MITDSFFQQGVSHEVCEDYALHGSDYVILSDGCSNGGGPSIDSDFGARLLCKAAEQNQRLLKEWKLFDFSTTIIRVAESICDKLKTLDPKCVTATLIHLCHNDADKDKIMAFMIGDGVIGGRKRSGEWVICNYDFLKGGERGQAAPFYLKYLTHYHEAENYMKLFGGNVRQTTYSGDLFGDKPMNKQEINWTIPVQSPHFCHMFPKEEFDLVFAGTDGLSSFYKNVQTDGTKHVEQVELIEVLKILLDIPLLNIGFLSRQRNWVFKKNTSNTFLKLGWHNSDDVSMGAIYYE